MSGEQGKGRAEARSFVWALGGEQQSLGGSQSKEGWTRSKHI